MERTELSKVQELIVQAMEGLSEKSKYTEAILAKKIREIAKLDGKKKAGISLNDLEKAVSYIQEKNKTNYSLTINSANDILIEKTEVPGVLSQDSRRRRLSSEKSKEIFTNGDLSGKKTSGSGKPKLRSERKKININSDFEDWE